MVLFRFGPCGLFPSPAAGNSAIVMMVRSWLVSYMKTTHFSMPREKMQLFVGKTKNHDTKEIRDVVWVRDPSASIKLCRGIHPNSPWKGPIPHRREKNQNSSIVLFIWPVGKLFPSNLACISRIHSSWASKRLLFHSLLPILVLITDICKFYIYLKGLRSNLYYVEG